MKIIILQYSEKNDPIIDMMLMHHSCLLRAKLKDEIKNKLLIFFCPKEIRANKIVEGLNILTQSESLFYFNKINKLEDILDEVNFIKNFDKDVIIILPFNSNISNTIYPENKCYKEIMTAMITDEYGNYEKMIYL